MVEVAVFLLVTFFSVWGAFHFAVSMADFAVDHVWHWYRHHRDQ
jgi:hypothetical protein